LSKKENSHM